MCVGEEQHSVMEIERLLVLDSLGKADTLVAIVEDGVEGANDGIAENPFDFKLRR